MDLDLKTIEDLEREMEGLHGEERGRVRRQLRRLRAKSGAGIPVSRVRGPRTTARNRQTVRIEGETPEEQYHRLTDSLEALDGPHSKYPSEAEAVAFPVSYPAPTLAAKYEVLKGHPPTRFGFIASLPGFVVLW